AHPAAVGGDGGQAGLLRVGADAAGAGGRRLGGVLRHGTAVDRDRLRPAVAAAGAVLGGVPAEADHDGHDSGDGQDDGQATPEAAAAVEVAGPTPGRQPGTVVDAPPAAF